MYGGDTRGEGKKEGRDKGGRKPLLMTKIFVSRGREKRRNRERERRRTIKEERENKERTNLPLLRELRSHLACAGEPGVKTIEERERRRGGERPGERITHRERASPHDGVVFCCERGRNEKKKRKREDEKEKKDKKDKKERGSTTLLAMEISIAR